VAEVKYKFTHRHNTQNNTMKQNTHTGTYIEISTHVHNNKDTSFKMQTEAYKTYNHILNDTKWNQKNMKKLF
jgi:kynurenine formamidase